MILWFLAFLGGMALLAALAWGVRRRAALEAAMAEAEVPAAPARKTERFPALGRASSEGEPRAERRAGAGLQGNLAQTPLHDLLQYLALGRKSGILELVSGRRAGRMVLKEGKVCKNSYRGKEGMDAMFMMMDLPEGDFEFYEQILEEAPPSAGLEVVDIIMLWMDRKPKKKA